MSSVDKRLPDGDEPVASDSGELKIVRVKRKRNTDAAEDLGT